MSYDLAIVSDTDCSQTADLETTRTFILSQPHMQEMEPRKFRFDDGTYQFNFWIDFVDDEGNTLLLDQDTSEKLSPDQLPTQVKGRFNLISTGIAYGFEMTEYFELLQVCFSIASHLNWNVLDHQTGEYIEEI